MSEETKVVVVGDPRENWSWLKFLKGFFDGRNYAKAVVLGFCLIVIAIIVFSVYSFVKGFFDKPKPLPTQTIGTNSGSVCTVNKDNREDGGFKLLDLSKWFSSK